MKSAARATRLAGNAERRRLRSDLKRAKRARQDMLADPARTPETKAALDAVAIATVDLVARRCREAGVDISDLVGPDVGRPPA